MCRECERLRVVIDTDLEPLFLNTTPYDKAFVYKNYQELRDVLEAKNEKKIKELTKSLITDINNRGI